MSDLGQNIIDIGFSPEKFDASKDHIIAGLQEVKQAAQELPPQFKATFDSIAAASNSNIKVGTDAGFGELKRQMAALQKTSEQYRVENERLAKSIDDLKNKSAGQVGATKTLTKEQALLNQQTAEANKLTKINAVLENSIAGSIEQHRAMVAKLTIQRDQLGVVTVANKAKQIELNEAINEHNLAINQNLDLEGQRIKNIGNYNGQLGVLSRALKGLGGLGLILSHALGIDPVAFEGIREAGRAIRDIKHIREGEELAKASETATTVANTTATTVNTVATDVNAASTKSATIAQRLYTFVVGESTGALKVLRIALATTGIGILLIGLGVLVASLNSASAATNKTAASSKDAAKGVNELSGAVKDIEQPLIDAKKAQEDLGEAFKSSDYTAAVKNVSELTINIELAKKGLLDKTEVLKEYNDTIGKTTGVVKTLDEAEAALVKNGPAYIQMMLLKAAANIALEKAAQEAVKAEEARIKKDAELLTVSDEALAKSALASSNAYGVQTQKERDAALKSAADLRVQAAKKRRDEEVRINQEASDKQLSIAQKFQRDAAEIAKNNKFDFFGGKEAEKEKPKKIDKTADENAKAEFERLKLRLQSQAEFDETIFKNEKLSYTQRLDALNDYANVKQRIINETAKYELSTGHKTSEQIKLIEAQQNVDTLKLAISLTDALKQVANSMKGTASAFTTAISGMTNSIQKQIDEINKEAKKRAEDGVKALADAKKKTSELEIRAAEEVANTIQAIGDNQFEREKNRIQRLIDANNEYASAETERINNSTLSEQDKAAKLIQLKAETDAKNKEFAKKQKDEDIKKAKFDKAFSIAKIIESTAQAEVEALTYLSNPITAPLYPGIAALIGVIGALQLGVAIAAPIPTYAEGTQDHPGGPARYGEAGPEAVVLPGGKTFIANKETVSDLPAHAKVIPLSRDYVNEVMYSSMMRKTSERLAMAEVIEMRNESRALDTDRIVAAIEKSNKKVVNRVSVTNDFGWIEYINKNIYGKG